MKYALLIYAAPGAREAATPSAGDGVFDSWLDYTVALKEAGALLAAGLGDLQAAEDAVSEAFVAAARTWPRDGVPPKPGAWLTVTARRKAIDQLRIRQHTSERGLSSLIATATPGEPGADPQEMTMADDRLGMI